MTSERIEASLNRGSPQKWARTLEHGHDPIRITILFRIEDRAIDYGLPCMHSWRGGESGFGHNHRPHRLSLAHNLHIVRHHEKIAQILCGAERILERGFAIERT